MNEAQLIPFERSEIPFGERLIFGTLRSIKSGSLFKILSVDVGDNTARVLICDFKDKYNGKLTWLSNSELFFKYKISFNGGNTWIHIGKTANDIPIYDAIRNEEIIDQLPKDINGYRYIEIRTGNQGKNDLHKVTRFSFDQINNSETPFFDILTNVLIEQINFIDRLDPQNKKPLNFIK